MNDKDWIVEVITEKDRLLFSFASYDTAEDYVKTSFLGLHNAHKEQIVKICIYEEKETP